MMRKRVGWWSGGCGWVAAVAFACLVLGGCGEQGLYSPPHSSYQIIGHVPLPSAADGVAILDNRVFVAGGEAGLIIVDVTDPHAPVLVKTIPPVKNSGAVGAVSTPTADGVVDIAFTVEGTEGIATYNVTNPDSAYSYNQGSTATDGNSLFVEVPDDPTQPYVVYLAENWKGLRIFESDPNLPGVLRYNGVFAPTNGYAKGVSVANGFAYVANDEMGLAVLDVRVRTLGAVRVVSSLDTAGKATAVAVQGELAYIADGTNGLVVMRVHGGDPPLMVSQLPLAGTCVSIAVRDRYAFIAAENGGVHVVDISNPAKPGLEGTILTTYATGVAVSARGVVAVSDRSDGLYVIGGSYAFRDGVAPGRVKDLSAAMLDSTDIRLRWRAPGNDLFNGTATQYDVRYATAPITDDTWDGAEKCPDAPTPAKAGTLQNCDARGLSPGTTYYFALKTADAAPNWSGLSNVATGTTASGNVAPTLTAGAVSPLVGAPTSTTFAFDVTFTDGDGDTPSRSDVMIGAQTYPMTLVSGDSRHGAVYQYETALDLGSYTFAFFFDDGHGHPVSTAPAPGPFVGPSFTMGSPSGEPGRDPDETLHTVVLTRQLWVCDHEVTQSEYQTLMGTNPSHFVASDHPVESVTWFDAIAYCNARSTAEGYTPAYAVQGQQVTWDASANGYRLPTEAEWERACRAGTSTAFPTGAISEIACVDSLGSPDPSLAAIGWFCGNSANTSHDVKQKQANADGLYDMSGNVWEWCWDWYGDLGTGAAVDPAGPADGVLRVRRGGSWYDYAKACRSASRDAYYPNSKDDLLGFRVVRTIH